MGPIEGAGSELRVVPIYSVSRKNSPCRKVDLSVEQRRTGFGIAALSRKQWPIHCHPMINDLAEEFDDFQFCIVTNL